MKIAIIGSGISGLGAAYLLSPYHDITIYEKNSYNGGHSRTIDIQNAQFKTPVDTGFIVFNNWNYPNLVGLFDQLNVPYQKSDMSFGASINNGWMEYGSDGMFAQKKNLFRPQYYKMLFDIIRFNRTSLNYIEKDIDITLEDCLNQLNMGTWFRRYYLLAMGAAIWSCPIETIMKFPARTFLQFFKNHGLLSINNRPQWYTVTGGSREYVSRIVHSIKDKTVFETEAVKIIRDNNKVSVTNKYNQTQSYDHVIMACHADEVLKILENPTKQEVDILSKFRYQDNHIIVHNDTSFMPKEKKCWASWVYLSEGQEDKNHSVSLTYWMNNLQNIDRNHPIFVTLNPTRKPLDHKIFDEHIFSHPIFDSSAINAQSKIKDIQGKDKLSFCGAYQRYGFHEDGLLSAVNVAKNLGVQIPWEK